MAAEFAQPLARELASLARLQSGLRRLYRTSLRPTACLTPDTLVCRCEAVAVSQIEEAIDDGARTLHEVKIYTRAGMGLCQGRVCEPISAALLTERLGVSPESLLPGSVRPPGRPIPLENLAEFAPEPAS